MLKHINNPEVKKSSFLLLVLSFLIFLSSQAIIKSSYEGMKKAYINNNASIVGKISKEHPELESEIISIITRGSSNQEKSEGIRILKGYGYGEKLDVKFMPELKDSYIRSIYNLQMILVLSFIILFIFNLVQYLSIYGKIEKLIISSKNMLEGKFDIEIYESREGSFSKLINNFNNMRIVIKNNYEGIKKEKEFLADILADISHQLKTPISSLIIYNDILINKELDEIKRKEFLERSGTQLNRIEWLIKSLLKLARLDAGVIKFEKNSFNINDTVEEAVEAMEGKAMLQKVSIVLKKEESPIRLAHDGNWLCEAIINILKNAIEHTKEGGHIEIYTEKTPMYIRIKIIDNGEGIPKEELPYIFKRFYKGKKSKKSESIGIGLALSKAIVEGHEGIIEVKSEITKGTEFSITFLKY